MNSSVPLVACTGGLLLGGSTTFLVNLGRSLREQGVSLPVVCMAAENEMAPDFASACIPVDCLPGKGLIYEDRILRAYQAIAAHRPAAVLACLGSESFETLRLLPQGVIRLGVIQADDSAPYEMTRHFVPWLDFLVGVSETICRKLRADPAIQHTRVECIPYGIAFAPEQTRPSRDPAQPIRLLYLGRVIEEQKRVSRLAELAQLLTSRQLPFSLTLAGGGPDLAKLQERLKPFPNVRFLGEVPNSATRQLFREHDIFLLLSDYEGLPLSLLEAMGEGAVPVVSDLESGMREVVVTGSGIRVPVGDLNAAAEAISMLFREPARLQSLSAAATLRARDNYSATQMARRYLDLIGQQPKTEPVWTEEVAVPTPLIVKNPWLYRGLPRHIRRVFKKLR